MDMKINVDPLRNLKVDTNKFQKMLILFNSIEQGWNVKKKNESYVFTKPHENKKEILENSYLLSFMKSTLDLNKIVS
jgi:hypothetical protein